MDGDDSKCPLIIPLIFRPTNDPTGSPKWRIKFKVCTPEKWLVKRDVFPQNARNIYNPYKWPYKRVTGVITLQIGVITQFITSRGPPCRFRKDNWVVATQIFFMFTPKIGEDESILTSIVFKWVGSTTN